MLAIIDKTFATDRMVACARDGVVTFNNLVIGSYSIQASKSSYVLASAQTTIAADNTTNIPITLQPQFSTGGGGIPGFPNEATLIGLSLAAILFVIAHSDHSPRKPAVLVARAR